MNRTYLNLLAKKMFKLTPFVFFMIFVMGSKFTNGQCAPDITPPTITCPADITVDNDPSQCGATVTYSLPTVTDVCDPSPTLVLIAGQVSGSVFPVGTTTVTYEAEDADNNTADCSFTVTVNDVEDPTISGCPSNITVDAGPDSCSTVVNWAAPTANDNCPSFTISQTAGPLNGTAFPVGTTGVTYTATDAFGNTATCNFTVTVNDDEDPTISCPSDISQSTDPGVCNAVVTYTAPVGTDNCPGATTVLQSGIGSGGTFPLGVTVETYVVTDAAGNKDTCSFNVTITDDQDPTISCPANISQDNDAGNCTAVVTYTAPVGTDNCSGSTTAQITGFASGAAFPVGVTTNTFVVTDGAGNTDTCSFEVTINDVEDPTISCPSNITQTADVGQCTAVVTYTAPVGTDNCTGATTAQIAGLASGAAFPVGATVNTFVVTDGAGNTDTCSFTVTVTDDELPVISGCPADVSQNADLGTCGKVITWSDPSFADNCPGGTINQTAGLTSGSTFPVGVDTIVYTATDNHGNTATCSFTVTIIDNENPTISCPSNVSDFAITGTCGAIVNYSTPVGADNCTGAITTQTAGLSSGSLFSVGTTFNTFEVTDASGNLATCTFSVTVIDTIDPTISACPSDITANNTPGQCNAVVTYTAPTGSDNCPGESVAQTTGLPSGSAFPVGVTTNTFVVTDASGNTASCSFTVTINDVEDPTISCPADIVVSNDAGTCGAVVTYTTPVGADNCPGSTTALTAGLASGATFPVGVTTNTYVVTDDAGNTASCSFTVTVNDTEAPTITCPGNITQSVDPGQCNAVVTYTAPVGTDNCPGANTILLSGIGSGGTFPVGVNTETYEVTDAAGNKDTCSFTVTINETEDPVITCPSNITQDNDAGNCTAVVTYTAPVGTDNCPGATTALTAGLGSGATFPLGATTETYEVTDATGNTASCSFTVTIIDVEDPTISCPSNITQDNDAGNCTAVVTYTAPVGTDNCPGATTAQTAGLASGAAFPVGITTNTFVVTDGAGNTDTCSFTVTVNDTEDPQITCPANITANNDLDSCNAVVTYTAPVGTDNCPGAVTVLMSGIGSGGTFPIGVSTEKYEVTDAAGNTTTCSFTVTVNDNQNPVISGCPSNILDTVDPGTCGAIATWVAPTAEDNCPGLSISQTAGLPSGSVFPAGVTTITYTATDAAGNTTLCSFTVSVVDDEDPVISLCPSDILLNSVIGQCSATATWFSPTVSDNCGPTTLNSTHTSGQSFPVGTTTVVYTATDSAGNTDTCSFDIIVTDTENPQINCPSNITVNNDPGNCDAVVTYTAPVGTDNCPGATTVRIGGQGSGTAFPVGNTTEIYEVTDSSGNKTTCSFIIQVLDNEAPVITCPGDITVNNDPDSCGAFVTYAAPTTSDNCPGETFVQVSGLASGSYFPVGSTVNVFEATDAAGNTSTCSFTVTVNDNQAPEISLCAQLISGNDIILDNDLGQCGAVATWTVPTATDNCPGVSLSASHTPGTFFNVGTTTVTYTATDVAGNITLCSFDVVVSDTTDPVVTCPTDVVQGTDVGVCTATVTVGPPTVSDNCGVQSVTNNFNGSSDASGVYPKGLTTVLWTVTDSSGNVDTCSMTVTVNDDEDPVLTCPNNIVVSNDTNVCDAVVNYTPPTATDNCPGVSSVTRITGLASGSNFPVGVTTNTFVVTDLVGNSDTCSFTVTVNDTQKPAFTGCPLDIVVNNDLDSCNALVTWNAPLASDNCPGVSLAQTSGAASGSTFPVGVTTITYTATDASGNVETCSFTITVKDVQDPIIASCPVNISVNNDAGNCNAIVSWSAPTASDNCSASISQTAGLSSGSAFPVGTTNVIYVAQDLSGNADTCSFDVVVNDTEDPTITCPANISVNNDAGVCGATVNYTLPSFNDNCSGASLTLTSGVGSGNVFPVGTTTEVYVVTDAAGNTATCSFDVTVTDTEDPIIDCGTDITQNADLGSCHTQVFFTAPVGTDNCLGSSTMQTAGQTSGSFFLVGTTVNTYVVTDAAGNTATCNLNVTVLDIEAPEITNCPADIVLDNAAGSCGQVATWASPDHSDNCSVITFDSTHTSGTVFPVGTTEVTYIATDAAGNADTCSFDVTINDVEPPVIDCPNDTTLSADAGVCGAVVNYVTPIGLDNCVVGVVTVQTAGLASGSVFPIGTTTNTYDVTDAAGNTATCSFDVTVTDDELPTIVCPANVVVDNDAGNCSAVVSYTLPTFNDNCTGATLALISGIGTGNAFPLGTTTETYVVTDSVGNTDTCSFDVTVNDGEDPIIDGCPADIVVDNDLSSCDAVVSWNSPTVTDNCPGVTIAQTTGPSSGATFPIGVTTIEYIATDAAGNADTCTFTVTVNDTEDPSITCPANVTVPNDPGFCTAVVTYPALTTSDNCPGETLTQIAGLPSGAIYQTGTTTNTFVVTDASGNTDTCSFDVVVQETEAPDISATCPADIVVSNDAGSCDAVVTYVAPVGTDNCPGASTAQTAGLASGDTFPLGTTTNIFVVTDASGNKDTCTFTVTVNDTEDPIFTSCQGDTTLGVDASQCGAVVTYSVPTASDNCPGESTTQIAGLGTGAFFPVGTTTETYVVTDAAGNTDTCSFEVTVVDDEDPIIDGCPANIVVDNNLGNCDATVSWNTPTTTDNCPGVTIAQTTGPSSGTAFPVGVTTIEYTATDAAGNTVTCTFTVTVNDTEAPSISCLGNIVVPNDPGFCTAVVTYSALSTSDNCPGETLTQIAGLPSGAIYQTGTTTNVFVVTDAAGNTDTCSFDVVVQETEAPDISATCPADIVVGNDAGNCDAVVTYVAPVGTDNCPGASTVQTAGLASGATFPLGTTTNIFVVTDASGNTDTCTFTVTVNDTEDPTIACTADTSLGVDSAQCGAIVTYTAPVATDNCPGESTTQVAGLGSGAFFPVGVTTETYVVTDAAGNTDTCSFEVTVVDDEDPIINNCPADITVSNDFGSCGAVVSWTEPVAADNCPGASIAQTSGPASGSTFVIGNTTIEYTATDSAGNTVTCTFTVTVNDTEAPSIACPSTITVPNDTGFCTAAVTYPALNTTDNCPGEVVTQIAGLPSGSNFPAGTTTNTFVVTDASGNTDTCSFDVIVQETEAPEITCPGDIVVNNDLGSCDAVVTYTTPIGTDNCPGASTVQIAGLASGSAFPFGITTNTFVVTDASGNTDTCSFDVTVNDAELPTIVCPSDTTIGVDLGQCGAVFTYSPIITDNCPGATVSVISGVASGGFFSLGTTSVSLLVVDAAGNVDSCSFNVTVVDDEDPVFSCTGNLTVPASSGSCDAIVNYAVPSATENCGTVTITQLAGLPSGSVFTLGTTTNIFVAVDAVGNTDTCTFDVTVVDEQDPILTCVGDIIQNADVASCGKTVTFVTPTIVDNCFGAGVNQIAGLSSGSFFPVGTTTNIFVGTDASGNTDTCTFNVIVNDVEDPRITCQNDTVILADTLSGTICGAIYNYTVIGSDNCTGDTITQTAGLPSGSIFPVGTTTNTFVITDGAGNTATCSFDVTVTPDIPVATFTATGTTGLEVAFTLNSTDTSSVTYDFGDGNTSNQTNPTHTYAAVGTYYVCLTVGNTCGSDTICDSVVVEAVSVSEVTADRGVSIYPNPNNGTFVLSILDGSNENFDFAVYNLAGQVVHSERLLSVSGRYKKEIRLDDISFGVYMVKVLSEDGSRSMTERLIIK